MRVLEQELDRKAQNAERRARRDPAPAATFMAASDGAWKDGMQISNYIECHAGLFIFMEGLQEESDEGGGKHNDEFWDTCKQLFVRRTVARLCSPQHRKTNLVRKS